MKLQDMLQINKTKAVVIYCVLIVFFVVVYAHDAFLVRDLEIVLAACILYCIVFNTPVLWALILYIAVLLLTTFGWLYERNLVTVLYSMLRMLEGDEHGMLLAVNSPQLLPLYTEKFWIVFVAKILSVIVAYGYYKTSYDQVEHMNWKDEFLIVPRNTALLFLKCITLIIGTSVAIIVFHQFFSLYTSDIGEAQHLAFVSDYFLLFFAFSVVYLLICKVYIKNAVFFYLHFLLSGLFYVTDRIRDGIIYERLKNISVTEELHSNASAILPNGLPSGQVFTEPHFYGNILVPWIPDEPQSITLASFMLLPGIVVYCFLYFIYAREITRITVNKKVQ